MWGFPQREAEHAGASRVHFVATGDDMESTAGSRHGSSKRMAVDKVKVGESGPPALARHSLISQDLAGVE